MEDSVKVIRSLPSPEKGEADILICAATLQEVAWACCADNWTFAEVGRLRVAFLVTGPGQVNAAFALGHALAFVSPKIILSVGIGGALPSSGLSVGDVAVATSEIDADWGVEPADGELFPGELSIPRLTAGRGSFQGKFPVNEDLAEKLAEAVPGKVKALCGPFVTSSTVTATKKRGERLETLHGAICENMEGAALAHGAAAAGLEFCEVRGISNMAGPRDISSWRFEEASGAAGATAHAFLADLANPG